MHLVYVRTESYDEFYYPFKNKPTEEQITNILDRDLPEEVEADTIAVINTIEMEFEDD